MKFFQNVMMWVYLALFAAIAFGAYWLFKNFKAKWPGVSAWWQNLFGQLPSGTPIPDTTGSAGAKATAVAYNAVVNNKSQGFYNACLMQYANDTGGFNSILDAQGTMGWPWTSYDGGGSAPAGSWKGDGFPALPTAEYVTVDNAGVYHNDYI